MKEFEGYDENGFNKHGIHRDTGTNYDNEGYSKKGYDRDGYDRRGFNQEGYNREGYDRQGFNKNGYDKDGYNAEGYNSRGFGKDKIHKDTRTTYDAEGYDNEGFDRLGYNREGIDCLGIDSNGINKQTGQIDERVILGKEFISSQMTIPQYARRKGKTIEEIEAQVEIAKSIACIRDDVMSVLTKNSNRYIAAKLAEKDKLLEGKIEVRDVRGIEKILALCTEEEKVMKLLITSIASHNITILEYKDIFVIENFNSKLPQNIIDKISVIKREMARSKDARVRK